MARAPDCAGPGAGWAELPLLQVFRQLESSPRGLTEADAQERLAACGDNTVTVSGPPGWAAQLFRAAGDPFVLILLGLDAVSAAIGNWYSVAVISVLAALSCLLRLHQDRRASRAADALRDLVSATATVTRCRRRPPAPPRSPGCGRIRRPASSARPSGAVARHRSRGGLGSVRQ